MERNFADAFSCTMQNPRSIYGAVQQLILAARAFGVGTSLTLLHAEYEDGP
jgi:hypothetical protein